MASRNSGGPLKTLLNTIAGGVMVCILLIVLVATGGWNSIADIFGLPNSTDSSVVQGAGGQWDSNKPHLLDWLTKRTDTSAPSTTPTTGTPSTGTPSTSTPSTNTPDTHADYQTALTNAHALKVADARPAGYDREKYFGGWANSPTLCGTATTRDQILARDLTNTTSDSQCRVTSGTLNDPYTGKTIQFKRGATTSQAVQIDHVVALLDAWSSGARDWTQEQRETYANDPDVLLASDGTANQAKGDGAGIKDGTGRIWLPDNQSYRCDYWAKRVTIKTKYGLTVTPSEQTQTIDALTACAAN